MIESAMLTSFTNVLKGQLLAIAALLGELASAQQPNFTQTPQSPYMMPIIREFSPIIRDFFKHFYVPNSYDIPEVSQPAYTKRQRRATQPGPQQ